MQTITLPFYPQNYYGTYVSVENISVGDTLFIGSRNNDVQPVVVKEIIEQPIGYIFLAEDFKIFAHHNSRVGINFLR